MLWALAIVAALLAARYFDAPNLLRTGLEAIARLGAWGPVLFVLLYVAATVLFLPGSILTLGAGVVFGLARGGVIVSISATLGATAAFLVGRYVARDWVAGKIEGMWETLAKEHRAWDILGRGDVPRAVDRGLYDLWTATRGMCMRSDVGSTTRTSSPW